LISLVFRLQTAIDEMLFKMIYAILRQVVHRTAVDKF